MKTIKLVIVESVNDPDKLSVRLNGADKTATKFKKALVEAGFKPGDICELKLVIPGDRND